MSKISAPTSTHQCLGPLRHHKSLYAAFDVFPSTKGAAIHINRMARTLFARTKGGLLYVLGGPELPPYQNENEVEIVRFHEPIPNYLERALHFSGTLAGLVARQPELRIAQFRDPWSGVALLDQKNVPYKTIYEINGLPSIELMHLYPDLKPSTLDKIAAMERFCWQQADGIATPARVLKENLVRLGAPEGKITVISNGADIVEVCDTPKAAPGKYLIYFGALQSWQGVDVLLRAFAQLRDFDDLHLVMCSSTKERRAKPYRKLAEKLSVTERVLWRFRCPQRELQTWIGGAVAAVAPLTECARNLHQGCCPLKILESMACGVAVVASDIPAVREIVEDGRTGRLVKPDRPAELARALRITVEYPKQTREIGAAGRRHIKEHFTWDAVLRRLDSYYDELLDLN